MGHLNRALSLVRAVDRCRRSETPVVFPVETCVITNSSYVDSLDMGSMLAKGDRLITIDPNLTRDETAYQVIDFIRSTPHDVLIVDTFPRGLGGELADLLPGLDCCKVLVHRDLNPRYVSEFNLSSFVDQFELVIAPGELGELSSLSHVVRTNPWLLCEPDELFSPLRSRRLLQVDSDERPVVAVIGCGTEAEVNQMRDVADELALDFAGNAIVRFVTPRQTESANENKRASPGAIVVHVWPFLRVIRAVSVVVGGGGYNTVNEARATQTRLVGIPRKRMYDRQHLRLDDDERVPNSSDTARLVKRALAAQQRESQGQGQVPVYVNGANAAARAIAETVAGFSGGTGGTGSPGSAGVA
jgi:hypothetical protein